MRKMNFKKSAAVILSTVCMVTALVGCGSSSADVGVQEPTEIADESQVEAEMQTLTLAEA